MPLERLQQALKHLLCLRKLQMFKSNGYKFKPVGQSLNLQICIGFIPFTAYYSFVALCGRFTIWKYACAQVPVLVNIYLYSLIDLCICVLEVRTVHIYFPITINI